MTFLIIPLTLVILLILGKFEPVRGWWASVRKDKAVSGLIFLSFISTFLGGTSLESAGGIASIERILRLLAIIILFSSSVKLILNNMSSIKYAGASTKLMLVFGILAMLSATYSFDAIISIWKATEFITIVIVGFAIASKLKTIEDIQAVLNILMLVMLFMVTSSGLGAVLTPDLAFAKLELSSSIVLRGTSPAINSNTLTQFAALLAVTLFALKLNKAPQYKNIMTLVIAAIAVVIMLLGHSRTSIFSGMLAAIMVLYFSRQRIILIVITSLSTILFLVSDIVLQFLTRGQSVEVVTSLSGRTYFWEKVWVHVVESPYIGYGYYSAQREIFYTSSIDNSYLEVLLGLGFIGLTIFALPVIINGILILKRLFKQNTSSIEKVIGLQLGVLFILLFVRSFTGPTFQILHPNLVMYILLCISIPALTRLKKNEVEKKDAVSGPSSKIDKNPRILRLRKR